ncbi:MULTISPECIES: type IV toxin-antitoxin system AbiEi family antitoxin domain-containing protein [unclassified Gordonia (in: high G+C Gram-positive bacteria)]|uniref:type IV toxin-antitoxin system AbiEi family antitoxin domain-containing protein n=1 Tax=unclassified Gordonia (in: high G+C Gram-positive bacteria) TaxID=2657482 RepID=UPI000815739A|nr:MULTISPECIES: type IV toxin-antitoxin system AbiEi family antitoxin domain-containing protein [unclassified Gordonia (in: high G+C Gram-positive bacteria)]SCB80380.1 Transcriptional regulator, AbiEi antitoxin, Type IV TA system [Gordonia sp. v-85]
MTDDLRAMIASHDGVFTTHQAHSHGVSADGIRHRVRTGQWVRVTRGAFRVADRTVDDRMRMRLAVLQTGPGAALAGAAAAWWHGLVSRVPDVPVVVAPHGRHGTRVEDATVWHRTVAPRDLTEVDGLTVTGLELTVLDASVALGVKVMDSALPNKKVTVAALDTVQRRNAGRRGSPRARAMLEAMSSGARSEAERITAKLLEGSGFTGWSANTPACGYVLDFAFEASKIAIEIDGMAFHSDAVAFQRDRTRQNDLVRSVQPYDGNP